MAETIDNATAAASTLFLGHNGEWWDFWLIISVIAAAMAATAIGVTTLGSIVSHKREVISAEDALERYKLETGKKISEANARTKEAELALFELKMPRTIWYGPFKKTLEGIRPATVQVLYVKDCVDCVSVAIQIWAFLGPNGLRWDVRELSPIKPEHADPVVANLPDAMSVFGSPQGITVLFGGDTSEQFDSSSGGALVRAIATALAGPEVESAKPNPLVVTGGINTQLPKGMVRVVVAPKL
jgi:hypothetical protein